MAEKGKIVGGGGMSQRKKQRFNPLVASSLAIALGMSVASATTGFYQQNNGAQGSEISSFNGTSTLFKDISINGTNYTAFELDRSVKDEFKLFVLAGSNAWKSGDFGGKGQLDVQANSMLVSDQGLAIGNSGTGTLTLDLWTNNNSVQSFILDLSTVNSPSYAFLGNLNITGSHDGTAEDYSHKTFTGKLGGKGIKGNLTLDTKATTNFVFEQDANIDGNLIARKGNNTLNNSMISGKLQIELDPIVAFSSNITISNGIYVNNTVAGTNGTIIFRDDATIQGKIERLGGNGKHTGTTRLFFNGTTNTIDELYIADTNPDGRSVIDVVFEETTKDNIIHRLNSYGCYYNTLTPNVIKIVFKGSGINRIDGNIVAGDTQYGKTGGENSITFEKNGEITGDEIKTTGAQNTIVFKGDAEHSLITSSIIANGSGWMSGGSLRKSFGNTITFEKGGKIQLEGTKSITSVGGENYITFNGSGTLIGNISTGPSAYGANGITDIKFTGTNSTNVLNGNISVTTGATNTITFSGTNSTNTVTAKLTSNKGKNIITAKSGSATFSGIKALDYTETIMGNTIDFGSGIITANAMDDGNAISARNGGNKNQLTASTIIVNGNIVASGGDNKTSNDFFSDGTITINGSISGGVDDTNANNFTLTADNAILTLKGENNTISKLTAFSEATNGNTLTLDGSASMVSATIGKVANGDKLKVEFKGGSETASLSIQTDSLKELTITSGAKNTLVLRGSGITTISNVSAIEIGNNNGITFDLSSGSSVVFANGLTTQSGGSTGFVVGVNSSVQGNITNNGTQTFDFNTDNASLGWKNASGASVNISTPASAVSNINFNSQNGVLNTGINTNGGTTNITIAEGKSGTIAGAISQSNNGITNISLKNSSVLSLGNMNNTISKLESDGGKIDLATSSSVKSAREFKSLTINNTYSGDTTFNLYVDTRNPNNGKKSDQVNINNASQKNGSATFTVMGDIQDILSIKYNPANMTNNVLLASGTDGIEVQGGKSVIGYDEIEIELEKVNGNVYLGKATDLGVLPEVQAIASTALTVNYDLYLANFNSLNKRMGELRENPHSNGVWARVFGGNMSNDFGAGSKTDYITAQGGYDYGISVGENAKNYIGVAVAYGKSWTQSNELDFHASNGSITLKDVNSNMVEVGIYNSYVADNGWYNDTIFKFDYIMSSFTMTDNLSLESKTNNFAMILSDEFGYRYKFAESEKGNWYIDPQVEVAFGYFNQSDFNRSISTSNATLKASQDSILTLRTRAGMSLGKKFNTERGFASLYVGAFYEYDYIDGGDSQVLSASKNPTALASIQSNGRAILNVGSNIGLTESARLYIDVEKSFGDKQRTFMQFNLGARYSF